jgi:hypothetical protein
VPFPVPEAPDVTLTCDALFETAVHAQVLGVGVTVTVPLIPFAGAIAELVLKVK